MSTTRDKVAERLAALDIDLNEAVVEPAPEPRYVTIDDARRMAAEAAEAAAHLAVETMTARMAEASPGAAPTGMNAELRSFADGLAMAMAQLGNQGTGKELVDPAIIAKRAKARDAMDRRIAECRRDGIAPKYVLTGKVHLGNQLINPLWADQFRVEHQQIVWWNHVPNQAMAPADPDNESEAPACEAAREIFDLFCESIGVAPSAASRVQTLDRYGHRVSPRGNVFEQAPMPPAITRQTALYGVGDVVAETPAWPQAEVPQTGVTVRAGSGHEIKTHPMNVLGTIAKPARQQVA